MLSALPVCVRIWFDLKNKRLTGVSLPRDSWSAAQKNTMGKGSIRVYVCVCVWCKHFRHKHTHTQTYTQARPPKNFCQNHTTVREMKIRMISHIVLTRWCAWDDFTGFCSAWARETRDDEKGNDRTREMMMGIQAICVTGRLHHNQSSMQDAL